MKCLVCGKLAKWRWSPDLDIDGIGACDKHQEDVQLAYVMLLQQDEEMFESYITSLRRKYVKKTKRAKKAIRS